MKKYAYLQISFFSICLLLITGLGIYLYPLHGDLTRTGGFSENQFGPLNPQQGLSNPTSDFNNYKQYYDIIIIGDSFAQNRLYGWQQWLAVKAGLSVTTLHINNWTIDKLSEHPVFVTTPPKLVIFESAERKLEKRLALKNKSCPESQGKVPDKITISPDSENVFPILPPVKDYRKIEYEQAVSFLRANYRAYIQKKPRTISLNLQNPLLFSNAKSDKILVLKKDFSKLKWPTGTLNKSLCTLKSFQHTIQQNNTTWFVSTFAPDKTTAYLPYIESKDNLPQTSLNKIKEEENLNYVDLLSPIRKAISSGQQDIYLPNDSHWSSYGHKLVADSILNYLIENNIVINRRANI